MLLRLGLQVVFSIVLSLAPIALLRKDRLRISMVLYVLGLFAVVKVGGLIFAVPVAVLLLLFTMWLRFVGHADGGAKHALFILTIVLCALYLAQHVVHLPIRMHLDQPKVKIAANIAGGLVALAMLSAAVELLVTTVRTHRKAYAQAASATESAMPAEPEPKHEDDSKWAPHRDTSSDVHPSACQPTVQADAADGAA